MKCLSVRQPWAWLIIHGGKDIENRDWPTGYRGPLAIHASKAKPSQDEIDEAAYLAAKVGVELPRTFDLGGIVGTVWVSDCVTYSPSPWFFGKYGWKLTNPEPMPFQPLRGQLGLFEVDLENLNG